MEKLTRALVESHLMSFVDIVSEAQADGVTRWAWGINQEYSNTPYCEDKEWSFQFKTFETARNYAFGWIRRNRKDLMRAAVSEARKGIEYRSRPI